MDIYNVFMILGAVLAVIINLIILRYLIHLEQIGCKCAMDWRRQYIMFYMVLAILFVIASPFFNKNSVPILEIIYIMLGFLNTIFILQYVARLYKEKCECSQSLSRDLLALVGIINAILFAMVFVYLIGMIFSLSHYMKRSKMPKTSISIRPRK